MSRGTHRRRLLLAVTGAAVVAVAIAVAVSQGSGNDRPAPSAGGRAIERRLAGIPQDGVSLGSPRAPVTLVEFADLQCPFCAQYARDALPRLVDRYVRPGRVRMQLRLLSFIGPDSERAARVADAAALQDRLWAFSELFLRNQGAENSGYATEEFLRRLARATPGLRPRAALAERDSTRVDRLLARASQQALRLGVDSTPSFYLIRSGRPPQRLEVSALTAEAFSRALDRALGSS
ncbi:MAG: DsbA family protein [Solirubrobacteraceae bacterium]